MRVHKICGLAVLSLSLSGPACAGPPGGPPPGFFPQGMANTGTRYNTYCLADVGAPCVELMVKEWGQVCHAGSDSDHVEGTVPPGFRYKSWRCETDNPGDTPPGGKSGNAQPASSASSSAPAFFGSVGTAGTGTITMMANPLHCVIVLPRKMFPGANVGQPAYASLVWEDSSGWRPNSVPTGPDRCIIKEPTE
jgi:hypothetical protein